jgi:hypothetical protein
MASPRFFQTLALAILAMATSTACERNSAPQTRVTPEGEARSAANGADPTPKTGTLLLGKQSLERARAELPKINERDPLVVTVLSFGRDSDGNVSLNFTVKNHGVCAVTSFAGVAYGFDARGKASKVNAGGESYLAFSVDKKEFGPGSTEQVSIPVHHVPTAAIGVAHIDAMTCADGTMWTRP